MSDTGSGLEIDISVDTGQWPDEAALISLAANAAEAVAAEIDVDFSDREVSLLFTDDSRIGQLNADWRGKAKPTNVLSFPAPQLPQGEPGSARSTLGDIAFGYETVAREAADAGLTMADHITHLFVHGLLHLLGHDHEDDVAADAMEGLETAILARLGVADPYAGSEPELTGTAGGIGQ